MLETAGAVAAPLTIEGPRGYGLPRVLVQMAPFQADMLLAGLVHAGLLEPSEANAAAIAAVEYHERGGIWWDGYAKVERRPALLPEGNTPNP